MDGERLLKRVQATFTKIGKISAPPESQIEKPDFMKYLKSPVLEAEGVADKVTLESKEAERERSQAAAKEPGEI